MKPILVLLSVWISASFSFTQSPKQLLIHDGIVQKILLTDQQELNLEETPFLSFVINDKKYSTSALLPSTLHIEFGKDSVFKQAIHRKVIFKNNSPDTIVLENVVPLGTQKKSTYITGKGKHWLSRSYLYLPDREPLNVILPDNAWELGYASMSSLEHQPIAALTRRNLSTLTNGQRRRFETLLFPGGSIAYDFHLVLFEGEWQEGLRKIFQEYKLFDVSEFDNRFGQRKDLQWIQDDYVMHLFMAWDQVLHKEEGKLQMDDFIKNAQALYGGDDAIGIWPTWPTLGLDQRNQFDLFRDLPGGLSGLKNLSQDLEDHGSALFICYNPWDESTRGEEHLDGLYQIVKESHAKGVVLDTRGSSSYALQAAADSARAGVVMYSEGMAVPKDMQGIVSGRVHNALYYPPLLNLNRLIKPDFSIFRVAEVAKEPIKREMALSYFNGHGIEFNVFAPGKPDWLEEQYRFLGRTIRILRNHSSNLSKSNFLPLVRTTRDQIFVNAWPGEHSTLYTIFSLVPEGYQGHLFPISQKPSQHGFDVYNHEEIMLDTLGGQAYAKVDLAGFEAKYLGTNNEGSVGGVALYERLLSTQLISDDLSLSAKKGDSLLVWSGIPDYEKSPLVFSVKDTTLSIYEHFGTFEGKIVIQLFQEGEIIDQNSILIKAGTPRLISNSNKAFAKGKAENMVEIPAGSFQFTSTHGDAFIRSPDFNEGNRYQISSFRIDKHPVTNQEFKQFLEASGYRPADTDRFLHHWPNRQLPDSLANQPVVYISYEDAQAYAKWAGKRLPTEIEWQYAAQAGDKREWPWSSDTDHIYREKEPVTNTLTVYKIKGIEIDKCNLGNGRLDEVGQYPKGANPYGLEDLVGSVWQLTNDVYTSGSYEYIMMKGGSYFNPSSSWWYVQGGPRELHYRQYLLRVSQGFERNATVGFRCVQDLAE